MRLCCPAARAVLGLSCAVAIAAGCGRCSVRRAPSAAAGSGIRTDEEGQPHDPRPDPASTCGDDGPTIVRWLGAEPHVPLALSRPETGVHSAGQACCAPWATVRAARWLAVDAWGHVVGAAAVTRAQAYDATQCGEMEMSSPAGRVPPEAVGLYASDGFHEPPNARWEPSPGQRAALGSFVAEVERLAIDRAAQLGIRDEPVLPFERRVLFFRVNEGGGDHGSVVHEDDEEGSVEEVTLHAVAGGEALIVAHWAEDGRWILDFVDNAFSRDGRHNAYRPIAVFDMDSDGIPEVVFHWNGGDAWGDRVLGLFEGSSWSIVADSVGGSN